MQANLVDQRNVNFVVKFCKHIDNVRLSYKRMPIYLPKEQLHLYKEQI
jgi:hypothetical protein